ncbi:GIY-YIG nuclease family protein [Cupriavidus consociatus]|uniref:GIY-YIG nuclease family protein n=1 Tax=Cupriavidus consociatus TaxID=2821357 RepID=UPI001AE83E51|nr:MULTISPECIES: GIY-YIG nuclease family protein [unclassified Cupriavidus]MBP0624742.1 GIY-YIG nuclease family protein [Cupriavidus sp. LEh25]MDK2661456.1 GIY-YIG nuclease family protein [Cupriavidus sp. LEh21]
MGNLTTKQKRFLRTHKIPIDSMFDATGLSRAEYRPKMKELGVHFCFGCTPCRREGHTLRSRKGACIQCSTAAIAFQLRFLAAGYVYVAYSSSKKFVKIGSTERSPLSRLETLRKSKYGGVRDWELRRAVQLSGKIGEVEALVQQGLECYQLPVSYRRYFDRPEEAREVFLCSLSVDYKILGSVISRPEISILVC